MNWHRCPKDGMPMALVDKAPESDSGDLWWHCPKCDHEEKLVATPEIKARTHLDYGWSKGERAKCKEITID